MWNVYSMTQPVYSHMCMLQLQIAYLSLYQHRLECYVFMTFHVLAEGLAL